MLADKANIVAIASQHSIAMPPYAMSTVCVVSGILYIGERGTSRYWYITGSSRCLWHETFVEVTWLESIVEIDGRAHSSCAVGMDVATVCSAPSWLLGEALS